MDQSVPNPPSQNVLPTPQPESKLPLVIVLIFLIIFGYGSYFFINRILANKANLVAVLTSPNIKENIQEEKWLLPGVLQ